MANLENKYKLLSTPYYEFPLKENRGKGAKFYSKRGGASGGAVAKEGATKSLTLAEAVDASTLLLRTSDRKSLIPFYDYYGEFQIVSENVMRFFENRMKADLEIEEVKLMSPSGKELKLPCPYFALRTTKIVDCIDSENSFDLMGMKFSQFLADQLAYDRSVLEGQKPTTRRPPSPYFVSCKKISLKPGAISSDDLFFAPPNVDCKFIDVDFANELLKVIVAEGGDNNFSFWLVDPRRPFDDFDELCHALM